jgi:cyclopropane fatty-acyl-phospholipid synthase-like methyltransferase
MNKQFFKKLLRPAAANGQNQAENEYGRQLTPGEIAKLKHREFVGGMWDEIGALQFEFMKKAGLAPQHQLVDVGCGCLRGGVHFVRYLEKGNYYGMDLNASLIESGKRELQNLGILDRDPHLLVSAEFGVSQFATQFDYGLAVSLFTHLYANHIARCLVEMGKSLRPGGKFFATFFQAPSPAHLAPITHQPGGIVSHFDSDPFHYSFAEIESLAGFAGLSVELIGDWGHPRHQQMLCFSR